MRLIKRYERVGINIKITIGSSQKGFEEHNPLTGKEREEKIRRVLKEQKIKKYKIYHVPDVARDKDYVLHVLKIVGRFDTLITGNSHVLRLFSRYASKKPWNIESFEESSGRPGGQITSGKIRRLWMLSENTQGLSRSAYKYLKAIDFHGRLKRIKLKN